MGATLIIMTEPDWITTQSCLSSCVHHLLCSVGISTVEKNVVMCSGTLDWRALNVIFDVETKIQSGCQMFEEVIGHLAPVFLHVQNTYKKIPTEKFTNDHLVNLLWTHNEKTFVKCYELLQDDGVNLVLAILLMTAAIERSLGNVFLLKGEKVPSLLKDLLMTSELQEILGILPVKLMQVMIGPPLSLNLRNLVWHGFVMPCEMHKRYGYFLLILVLSLGEQLSRDGIAPEHIPMRENISFCETRLFEDTFPDITDEDISTIGQIISTSNIILPGFKVYWEIALLKYQEAEYGDFLTLILPQLESCLRVIYTTVNGCPERILTAEATSLYTTFEEILCLEDSNKVPVILGESYMELLLDLLVYPEGPRVRDRISHGEVDLFKIPKHLANHVLSILVVLLCKFQPKHLLPKNEYIQKVQQISTAYWPYFHPKSLLKDKSMKFLKSLIAWKTYPLPEAVDETKRNPAVTEPQNLMSQCVKLHCDYLNIENTFWSIGHGFDVNKMLDDVKNSFPKTAYQSKFEKEVIILLRHVISHALSASEQMNDTLHCRYKQWTDKQLRSRQRTNYMRLLKSVPYIREGLIFIGLISHGYSLHINNVLTTSATDCQKTIKILKMILQYAENLKTLTSAERNRWEESCKLTTDILTNFILLFNSFNKR